MELILDSFNVLATSDLYPETYKLEKTKEEKEKEEKSAHPTKDAFFNKMLCSFL